ncbi:MAG: PHP domain-containing protein [Clostridia bacterium]|nr:PHP domain-containing protein [Clostridia bacterium]
MKHHLIPEEGNFYKANLHAHSTVSDGKLTPKQLKEIYQSRGYSVLALTDHELLVDHSDLTDENFVMLTSFEYAVEELTDYMKSKTIELNMFAKDPHNVTQVCFDPSTVEHGETWRKDVAKLAGPPVKKVYTRDFIQNAIDEAKKNGFLVSLNHPHYSMETPEFFGNFNGLFAMEIFNTISFLSGTYEYNPQMYDAMLRRGKRISCIAADDCHLDWLEDNPLCDKFGGFVMIKARELTYSSVINAMEKGDFYASMGPLIYDLYVEDGKVHIHTSPVKAISMSACYRGGTLFRAPKGEYLTEAVFDVLPGNPYIRFDLTDEEGKHANTRGYFEDERCF